MRPWKLLVVLCLLVLTACAAKISQPLEILEPWGRPALSGQTSAVYFTIDNPNRKSDVLLSVSTSAAEAAELHRTSEDSQGVMSMHPQHGIDIPGEDQVIFKPGGLHVMLVELKQDLKVGDRIELHLSFENAGEITLQVPIQEEPEK